MKYSPLLAALMAFTLIACEKKPAETPPPQISAASAPVAALPAGHPGYGSAMMPKSPSDASQAGLAPLTQKAQVLSTIDASQYTYLEVKQEDKTVWLATTATTAKKGDKIEFDNGMVMTNFTSKILNRTFPSVIFVGHVAVIK